MGVLGYYFFDQHLFYVSSQENVDITRPNLRKGPQEFPERGLAGRNHSVSLKTEQRQRRRLRTECATKRVLFQDRSCRREHTIRLEDAENLIACITLSIPACPDLHTQD